ncbi:MAG: ABC transporter permease [Microbacteriaceae bacterium]|nr:ABC transporter permease [Microbacteriaceae bacterium]
MLKYILFRLLQVIPVLFGTTFLIFFMVFSMPGDPILALFGDQGPSSPEILAEIRAQYNLDKPFIMQYLIYMGGVFQGNFGIDFSGRPIADQLVKTIPVTALLALMATVFEFILAVVIGTYAGLRKGKFFDNSSLIVALILLSMPIFVLAFIFQQTLGLNMKLFPVTVGSNVSVYSLFLPAAVLAIGGYAASMRLTRASTIDTLNQDFVRTAYAKGLSRRRVLPVHVMRNSLIPTVTNAAINFGTLLVGATITEGIFNVPGVGNTLYQAIRKGENTTIVGFVTFMVLAYLLINLLVDLLYAVLDPRIRYV